MASKRNLTIGLVVTGAVIATLAGSEAGWALTCQAVAIGLLIVWRERVQSYLKRQFAMPQPGPRNPQDKKSVSADRLARELKIADQGRMVRRVVHEHVATLSRNRRRLVTVDEYGVADDTKWRLHEESFFARVVAPQLPHGPLDPVLRNSIRDWIDEAIDIFDEETADVE
jgi:hypothetical protein